MGDTGSLSLGAALGTLAILLKKEMYKSILVKWNNLLQKLVILQA